MSGSSSRAHTVSVSLNTVEQTLGIAKKLISLAERVEADLQNPVAASATLAMAAGLQQAVVNALSFFVADRIAESDGEFEATDDYERAARLLEDKRFMKFSSQVNDLPVFLSDGLLELDGGEKEV